MKKALSLVLTMCMVLTLFATFVVSASAEEAVNVAAGKSYTTTAPNRKDGYDDDGKKLTDGTAAQENPGTYKSCIWNNPDKTTPNVVEVVVDLGEATGTDTYVVYLAGGNWGIVLPTEGISLEVFVSDKADSGFVSVASAAKDDMVLKSGKGVITTPASWSVFAVTAKASSPVSARYVKFVITAEPIGGAFIMFDEVEVYSAKVQETKVIGIDRANHYDWTQKDYQSTAYTPSAVSAGEILIAASAEDKSAAKGCFGDNIFDWWYAILAEWDASANAYVITEIDLPGTDNGEAYETWTVNKDKIVIFCNTGYASTEPAGNKEEAEIIKTLAVGDKLVFDGVEWADIAATSGALEGATVLVNPPSSDNGSTIVKETITVDGDVTDNGWAADKWINVTGENGTWQHQSDYDFGKATCPEFSYKYQMRADETKLYVAVEFEGEPVNDKATQLRLWIRDNDDATVYTSFYDIFFTNGAVGTLAKYNKSTTTNDGAERETTTLAAKSTVANGKTVIEFSVDIAEFSEDGKFDYYICLAHKVGENAGTLYYPAVPYGPTSQEGGEAHQPHKFFPWNAWAAEKDATVDVKDIALGEIVVSDKEEPDTSMMGEAVADPAFTVTLATENGWKAGKKLVVTATVDVLKDGVDLSQLMFNLYYDASDVEITLPEDDELGAIITTGAESWKVDSLFTLKTVDKYGVIECAPATTKEADVLKKGTQLVMTFEFTVKNEAEGLINFQLSNNGLIGYCWDLNKTDVAGAGSSLAVENQDELGDTGIYVIAALAVVALIGTAIVIKKRA